MSENTTETPTPVEATETKKRRFPRPDRKMLIAAGASFAAGALTVLTFKRSKDDENDDADNALDVTVGDDEVTEIIEP